ncbi:hypothetical protein SE86_03205 [Acidilobus sp. 7A]|nr:hypothetical protein SE86_03205 [Acidilobus sp. 7A]
MLSNFGECEDRDFEELIRLLKLSRLSFDKGELEGLCNDIKNVRALLLRVSKYKDLRVDPLYNVWDKTLNPPDEVAERRVEISWLSDDRLKNNMVKVPWRGG